MTNSDLIQIILMGLLVVVTGIYAWRTFAISNATKKQADASVKMADEMRNARYDTVRPVIDIERRPTELERTGVIINIADKNGRFPDKLICILRNIGIGPATDVYSFVQPGTQPDDKRPPMAFVTLAKNGQTDEMPLSLKPRDNRKVLVVYYRDVYGRYFESSREVNRSDWKLGPLMTREISKEEFPK